MQALAHSPTLSLSASWRVFPHSAPHSTARPSSKEMWVMNHPFDGSCFSICWPSYTSNVLLIHYILKRMGKEELAVKTTVCLGAVMWISGPTVHQSLWLWEHGLVSDSLLLALWDVQGCWEKHMSRGASLWVHLGTVGICDYNMKGTVPLISVSHEDRQGWGDNVYWVTPGGLINRSSHVLPWPLHGGGGEDKPTYLSGIHMYLPWAGSSIKLNTASKSEDEFYSSIFIYTLKFRFYYYL